MTAKDRRNRERDKRRELILGAAAEVVAEEGLENLSIRKIAARIEYSPGIIYHYFTSKEAIVDELLQEGYKNILKALGDAQQTSQDPGQRIEQTLRNYISMALENPDYFRAFVLGDSPTILERTAVLFSGAAQKRPSIAMLCQDIKSIAPERDDEWVELTTQVLWTALFGMTVRLLIEKGTSSEQRQRLIDRHVEFVLHALRSMA